MTTRFDVRREDATHRRHAAAVDAVIRSRAHLAAAQTKEQELALQLVGANARRRQAESWCHRRLARGRNKKQTKEQGLALQLVGASARWRRAATALSAMTRGDEGPTPRPRVQGDADLFQLTLDSSIFTDVE